MAIIAATCIGATAGIGAYTLRLQQREAAEDRRHQFNLAREERLQGRRERGYIELHSRGGKLP